MGTLALFGENLKGVRMSEMDNEREEQRRRRRQRRLRMMTDPTFILAAVAFYAFIGLSFFPGITLEPFLTPRNMTLGLAAILALIAMSRYLGVFADEKSEGVSSSRRSSEAVDPSLVREIRNYLAHVPRSGGNQLPQVKIDEAFQGQLLARLTTESQSALSKFIESEVFKKTSEARFKNTERTEIIDDIDGIVSTYQTEMGSWRRNANVNLLIGLVCAVLGIGVMWQTLVSLSFGTENDSVLKLSDLYHFLARFGLVLIIESVAFFFLKLYREDRSMIRYLRNEITNIELKCLSLKAALSFGAVADLAKVMQSLSATERNFLVKKGDRVISDITYENSEIMLEKILGRYPELLSKLTKHGS